MEHWEQKSQHWPSIELKADDGDRVISIERGEDGSVTFWEQCDQYFSVTMSAADAIAALLEAADWIRSQSKPEDGEA